jgi:DNA-binding PucR family transcriptional regulator
MAWDRPSERIRQLIREGAELTIQQEQQWAEEFARASLSAAGMEAIAADPVLSAASDRATRATVLHWAAANLRDPGAPVVPDLDPETLDIARDLVRRGLDETAPLAAYRVGQAIAWRLWQRIAFSLTTDPAELQQLLDFSAQSLSAFTEETLQTVTARMRNEREELLRVSHPERREVVALILDGAPIPRERAEMRLGYDLSQTHTAAVVWSMEADSELGQLEQAADALMRSAHGGRALTIVPGAATIWVWLPGTATPDPQQLARDIETIPGVRIAIGPAALGVEGFRRSHLDALTTQRMLTRLDSAQRVAAFDDVELASLITTDRERADQFVRHTLGDLATASAELRETVLAFVRERGSIARTAARLYTHRNTVVRRLARADELLPRRLEQDAVRVAVALEVLHWRGEASGIS